MAISGPVSQQSRSLRILLVEDHDDTLQVFARLLRHFGHEISMADCAQSAFQLVESKEFDLLLSDIGLPDGSGYDVVSHAKQKQPIKAVALTGLSRDEDIRLSKEAGFDFHLTKPVDFFELRAVLNQIGGSHERYQLRLVQKWKLKFLRGLPCPGSTT